MAQRELPRGTSTDATVIQRVIYLERAKDESQQLVGEDGDVTTEWRVYLGLHSGRITSLESLPEGGYLVDGVRYTPVGRRR